MRQQSMRVTDLIQMYSQCIPASGPVAFLFPLLKMLFPPVWHLSDFSWVTSENILSIYLEFFVVVVYFLLSHTQREHKLDEKRTTVLLATISLEEHRAQSTPSTPHWVDAWTLEHLVSHVMVSFLISQMRKLRFIGSNRLVFGPNRKAGTCTSHFHALPSVSHEKAT